MAGRINTTKPKATKSTGKKPTRAQRPTTRSPFDVIPGTHVDEYVAPWVLGWVVLPVVGMLAHLAWGHGWWVIFAPLVLVAGGLGLAAIAWHDAAPRKPLIRIRVAVSVAFALTSVAVTTVTGFVDIIWDQPAREIAFEWVRPWADLHLLIASLLSLSWNILRTDAVRGLGDDDHHATAHGKGWDELAGIPGATVTDVTHDGPRTTATITTAGAQDTQDAQQAARPIRALTRSVSTTIVPHPSGDPRKARITLLRRDPLKTAVPWPGPSHPGGSITDPVRVGVAENATESQFWIANGPDGRAPFIGGIAGVPGSGKSRLAWNVWADGASRRDVVWWVSDTAKEGQTTTPAKGLFDWIAPTAAETQAMLAGIEAAAKWRATYIGKDLGLQEWHPESGLPYIVVWFEEAARVADRFAERIIRLTELIRSTGITIVFSMQRMSATNMPTDARHNLTGGLCFGTGDDVSASFVLTDGTLDAGPDPHRWKANHPGYHLMEVPGIPEDEWALRRRTYAIDAQTLTRAVLDGARFRPSGVDVGTAEAIGPAYASRDGAASRPPVPLPRPASRTASRPASGRASGNGSRPASGTDETQNGTGPRTDTLAHRALLEAARLAGIDPDPDPTDDDDPDDPDLEQALLTEDEELAREMLEPIPEDLAAEAAKGPIRPGEYAPVDDWPLGGTPDPPERQRIPLTEQAVHVRDMIRSLMGERDGMDVDTAELVDAWEDLRERIPGIPTRPALYRWLERYMTAGLAEDRGRGRWFLHRASAATTVTLTERDEEGGDTGELSTIAV